MSEEKRKPGPKILPHNQERRELASGNVKERGDVDMALKAVTRMYEGAEFLRNVRSDVFTELAGRPRHVDIMRRRAREAVGGIEDFIRRLDEAVGGVGANQQ